MAENPEMEKECFMPVKESHLPSDQTPMVSVAMITYNHEAFIREAIEGVLMQQTTFPYELVIGEDCSTDRTREICIEYQQKHPNKIRLLLNEKNLGMMPNFIQTLNACSGKYIALCEGDDYWTDPMKLQKQVDFLEGNGEYVLTFHDVALIDSIGNKISDFFLNKDSRRDRTKDELIMGFHFPTCTILFRRSGLSAENLNILNNYKGYNGDTVLNSLLGKMGNGKYIEELKNAVYRIHPSGIWGGSTGILQNKMQYDTYNFLRKIHLGKYRKNFNKICGSLSSKLTISSIREKNVKDFLLFYIRANYWALRNLEISHLIRLHKGILFNMIIK